MVLGVRCLLSRRQSYWRPVKWYVCSSSSRQIALANIASIHLHLNQEHPDAPLLGHTHELIAKLESLGIQPSPEKDGDEEEEEGWEDVEGSDDDGDVEMS